MTEFRAAEDIPFGEGVDIPPPLSPPEEAALARGDEVGAPYSHPPISRENGTRGGSVVPSVFTLDVETARAFCERPDPLRSGDLLGPALRRGARTVVGGATVTGDGKTTLCLHMIAAVVLGIEFLGWQGHGGLKALVLDLEQGEPSLKRALREAGLGDCATVDVIRVPDGLELDRNAGHVAELERILEAGGYDLLFLDPTYKAHVGDSNEERHVVSLMKILDGWRERFFFALLMATHSRKRQLGTNGFAIDDLFGSSAFVRGCEVVLGIQLVEQGSSKLHFLKDRDGALPVRGETWVLDFDREQGYRRSDRPEAGENVKASAAEIAAWIRTRPASQATTGEIAARFEMSEKTVKTRRKGLAELHITYAKPFYVVVKPGNTEPEPEVQEAFPVPVDSAQPSGLAPEPEVPETGALPVEENGRFAGSSDEPEPEVPYGTTPPFPVGGVVDENELERLRRKRDGKEPV